MFSSSRILLKKKYQAKLCQLLTNMSNSDWKAATSVHDFTAKDIKGNEVALRNYKDNVLLIVNVASKCGLTENNYKQLVALDEKYRDSKGLKILAFPCNQFLSQEPGSSTDICHFAASKNATFDMFEKVKVNGEDAHPLWKYLKLKKSGGLLGSAIKWNFTKFIIDKNGQPVERFGPQDSFEKIEECLSKYW